MDLYFQTDLHRQVLLFADAECMYPLQAVLGRMAEKSPVRCVKGKTFAI